MITKRDWSDLPADLLFLIGNRLDTHADLPRIRAVCKSWRSSFPAMVRINNSFRIHINPCMDFTVEESTLYRFKHGNSKSGGEFVVKAQGSEPGKFSILNPLYYHQGTFRLENIPRGLNLLDCRVFEFQKTYGVNFQNGDFCKAAYSIENSTLLFIHREKGLVFIRARDDTLTQVQLGDMDKFYHARDVTLYNGNFYVVNMNAQIIVIDSRTMNITSRMKLPGSLDKRKYFVQSQDNLYVGVPLIYRRGIYHAKRTYKFGLYRLNESDCTWVSVQRLWNQVVFISNDCSFIASLAGFLGNTIYYITGNSNKVFCSEDDCYRYGADNAGVVTLPKVFLESLEDFRGFDKNQHHENPNYQHWIYARLIPM